VRRHEYFNYYSVAKLLLEKGADPNLVDWKGMNGMTYALKRDNYDLAFAILKQSKFTVDLNKQVEVLGLQAEVQIELPYLRSEALLEQDGAPAARRRRDGQLGRC
jgi:ankyrin repeat protein